MKWVLLLLAVNALVVPGALADENNLSNGALIAHHVAAAQYTVDIPTGSWCSYYAGLAEKVTTCDQQMNAIPGAMDGTKLWFVLAAWTENKVCPSVQFGLDYTPSNAADAGYQIMEQGACFPVSGLELPGTNWPAPGTGIALTCTGDVNWTGNFIPVYYFWGYTYGAGTVDLVPDPQVPFIGFSNVNGLESWVDADYRGKMGLGGTAGKEVCPPTIVPGACCFDGGNACLILSQAECASQGGTFKGEATVCDPNPCPTTWACCVGDACYMLAQTECVETYGGGWLSGKLCSGTGSIACSNYNVCCLGESCIFVTLTECNDLGGDYVTDPVYPNCTGTVCPIAVEKTSWSTIKAIYR
jgi:hypothetical protein